MNRALLFFIASIILFSCKGPAVFKEEKFGTFSIKVADFFTALKKPEVRSSAYFEDTINNCLFMVVEESKDSMIAYGQKYDLNSYFDKTTKSLFSKLDDGGLANSYLDTVNSKRVVVGRVVGRLNDEHLVYFLAVVETKKGFYQLIFGMPLDQEARYTKDVHTMIGSFKEL